MKMVDADSGAAIRRMWVTLDEDEVRELHMHLVALFEDDPVIRPWHMHRGGDADDDELNIELADA